MWFSSFFGKKVANIMKTPHIGWAVTLVPENPFPQTFFSWKDQDSWFSDCAKTILQTSLLVWYEQETPTLKRQKLGLWIASRTIGKNPYFFYLFCTRYTLYFGTPRPLAVTFAFYPTLNLR
jgi:hypothetical protein